MQANQTPTLVPLAFAANGTKNVIPEASQITITPGAASLNDGFPPLTFTPVAAGGVPPAGGDFNGILNLITASIRWAHGGGLYAFSSSFAADANVTGYPQGAELLSADLQGTWISLNDGNTDNPDTGAGTKWVPGRAYGVTPVTGLTNANVTLTPAQAAKNKITLAGTLTGNVQIIFPTWTREWSVVNNTTGAFTVTAKTAAGTGIVLAAGQQKITGDGTNITQPAESIATATLPQHAVQLEQVQAGNGTYAVATGTANVHTIALTPALTARTDGMMLRYKAPAANTGAVTLADGVGTANVVGAAHVALQGGEYIANGDALVVWNSTINGGTYILIECTGGAAQVAPATQSQHAVQLSQLGFFQGVTTITGNTSLTSSAFGRFFQTTTGSAGGYTVALPPPIGGAPLTFFNASTGTLTLTAGNFNTAYGSGVTSVVLPANSTVYLECDGTSYNGIGGSASIGGMVRPHAANGTPGDFTQITSATTYTLPAGGTWLYSIQIFANTGATSQGSVSGISPGGTVIFNPSSNNAQGFAWRIQ